VVAERSAQAADQLCLGSRSFRRAREGAKTRKFERVRCRRRRDLDAALSSRRHFSEPKQRPLVPAARVGAARRPANNSGELNGLGR